MTLFSPTPLGTPSPMFSQLNSLLLERFSYLPERLLRDLQSPFYVLFIPCIGTRFDACIVVWSPQQRTYLINTGCARFIHRREFIRRIRTRERYYNKPKYLAANRLYFSLVAIADNAFRELASKAGVRFRTPLPHK